MITELITYERLGATLQYILGLPTDHVESIDQFGTGPAIAEITSTAEKLGYMGVFVTDHPAPPKSFLDAGGHHTLDPMITLASAATSTTKLNILTNLFIVAYRNPLMVAKSVATLDNLSQGRLILGVGAGYLKEEFKAAGVDYQTRGELLNSHLEIMQQAWTGNPVSATNERYEAEEILSLPTPLQRFNSLGPPIWVGGNSNNAIDRVVRFGEGWIPMPTPKGIDKFVHTSPINDLSSLERKISILAERWKQEGRKGKPSIAIGPWDAGHFGTETWDPETYLKRLDQLSELGVTHVPIMLSSLGGDLLKTRAQFLERVDGFARFVGL